MDRLILMVVGVSGASGLLLVDSAVKGTALLALAAVAAAILRRDSAATRHLVWLVAVVALLVVPALSAVLPRWRVLPAWAGVAPQRVVVETSTAPARAPTLTKAGGLAGGVDQSARGAVPVEAKPAGVGFPPAAGHKAAAAHPEARPAAAPPASPTPPAAGRNWVDRLPLVWAVGFCVLVLRLTAARWVLWNAERRATAVTGRPNLPSRRALRTRISSSGSSDPSTTSTTEDPLVTALEAARSRLGIRRPVTLLIHSGGVIPIVWGIVRPRLLLPASARQWDAGQLRSVLLHELAHVRRHDAVAQLLAQIACALHWFNPLAWLAGWRLGVERERACDDLVLASGVRPSTYAGHLLGAVAGLASGPSPGRAPARWAASCGLAMAGQSPLAGRLAAVLGKDLNRRSVSATLAAVALATAAGIVIPVAMLRAADEKPTGPATPAAPEAAARPQTRSSAPHTAPQEEKAAMAATLDAATERWLSWGEPVNGLRAAIVTRASAAELKAGEAPELCLVVQNVSDAPVRLTDAAAGPESRELIFKLDGRIQGILTSGDPSGADVSLRPREVVFLPMFPTDKKDAQGRTVGSLLAEELLKDPHETFVAKLKIEKAPAGAWTGRLTAGEANPAAAQGKPQPKDKHARALFEQWQRDARADGDFPGGLVGQLADQVKLFIRNNTGDASGDAYAKKMAPLVPRLDASHDWKPADVAALMDDIAAVTSVPLGMMSEDLALQTLRAGTPLPADLANAPWGDAAPNGLRLAWLLEPRAAEYRLNTPLKSRILVHNAGREAVVFRTRTWHQSSEHKATDATGAAVPIDSTYWTTLGQLVPFRLAPGEFAEVIGAGIGVGAMKDPEDWQHTRVGAWIDAKAGEDVTFKPDAVPLEDWNETPPAAGAGPAWWPALIAARLAREAPLPASADERTRLLARVTHDLFGNAPTAEETAAFVADHGPDALDALAKRLAVRPGLATFTGELKSAPTKFHVLPADPEAARKPRTASDPGHYTLRDGATLAVSRRPDGERVVNEAHVEFSPPDPAKPAGHYEIKLPDGYGTWAAAWVRGGTALWVQDNAGIRRYDITDPAVVKETTLATPAEQEAVPAPVRDALRGVLDASGEPRPATAAPK